jgi:ABC-2 type transport system permease protein
MSTAVKYLKFMLTCWKLNLAGAMEFRTSFLMQVGLMMINNTVWIFFWGVYFTRFPVVGGWEMKDVMMMWAVSAAGFGFSATLFGNSYRLANIIATGQLDTYLAQPKPVLLHVIISRMQVAAIGDILFGLILFGVFGDLTLIGIVKFAAALLVATLIFTFFMIIVQSLAFYIGNAEGLAQQFFNTFITFATYPTDIFRGLGRMVLFTVIPAGFISYLPVGFLREMEWTFTLSALGVALLLTIGGTWFFYRGLKRYGSGNMMSVRM